MEAVNEIQDNLPALVQGQEAHDNPNWKSTFRNTFQQGMNKTKDFVKDHEPQIRQGLHGATSAVVGALGSPEAKAAGMAVKNGIKDTARDFGSVARTMAISAGLGMAGSAVADHVRKSKRKKRLEELRRQRGK